MVQSCVNSFGADVIAANTASANIAAFTYTAMNAVFHAAITFTSQNLGARRYDRIWKIFWNCQLTVMLIGVPLCVLSTVFGPQLLSIYVSADDPARDAVIAMGMIRTYYVTTPYFLCRHQWSLLRLGARARKIVAADGRDDLRRLRDADRLDLHHFRVEAYASRPLCLLPHQLGHHRGHACRLLRLFLEADPPEARADRTRGSGYQKGVLIFLYASH